MAVKTLFLGSLLITFSAGIIIGYGWKGIELRQADHWGCYAPEYIGPTGDNASIEVYRLAPYVWRDGRRYGE